MLFHFREHCTCNADRTYMEDFNTGTLPHKKYYDLDVYERRRAAKAAKRGPAAVRPRDTSDPVRCLLSLMHNERVTGGLKRFICCNVLLLLTQISVSGLCSWFPSTGCTGNTLVEAPPGKSVKVQSGGNPHGWQACACWACHVSPS